ncbi:hypothetical protein PoB_005238100 [Plakobranchus ocellatus]|uniref:Uncharacterized protein n=1 Tax=Plakobranchus ocellatus TaxID=259542 RepID=A0AAV4C3B1_9GAST|nr:hypothetical protein PoB_005238100 [Plakobranchus ocellatus]
MESFGGAVQKGGKTHGEAFFSECIICASIKHREAKGLTDAEYLFRKDKCCPPQFCHIQASLAAQNSRLHRLVLQLWKVFKTKTQNEHICFRDDDKNAVYKSESGSIQLSILRQWTD